MRVPFVVYADFECFTKKLDTTQPNPKQSYTKQYQKHTPSGFCYYIKCFNNSVYKQESVIYTKQSEDEDVAQIFFHKLVEDLKGFTWIVVRRKWLLHYIEGWIPDTGPGNSVPDLTAADEATQLASLQAAIRRLNIHNLNTGYMKRREVFNTANGVANRQGSWIKWPLGPLFAFLDHNEVTINLPIKLSLKRKANDRDVFLWS